jgi:protease IV
MKDLVIAIFNIFKAVGKIFTLARNLLLNLVFLALTLVLVLSLLPQRGQQLPTRAILSLDLTGDIVEEQRTINAVEKMFQDMVEDNPTAGETVLQNILDTIDSATADSRVVALVLNLKDLGSGGLDQLQAIGNSLNEFKKSGKTVVAAGDYFTQTQYYLASYADKILLNPLGGVELHGIGVYRLYFREAMEKLAINYNIFKVGTYKSALEPFTRDDMSPEDRQQNQTWLSSLWQVYLDGIIDRRKISRESLRGYTDQIDLSLATTKGDVAQLALQTGLVDQLATRGEVAKYLAAIASDGDGEPAIISSRDYADYVIPSYDKIDWQGDKVGLIIAEGNILPGKQPPGLIGGDSLAELIKEARDDKQVKALVLRINTGGGSAFASEVIRQELLLLQKSGKPVVVSMGTVAASGGYWIAADADEIWASEATITGSIGIFGAIPTFEKTLASLGVRSDGTGTTPLAAGLDLTQPLPDPLKNAIQQAVAHNYNRFLDIVASGRELEKLRVDELAEGRVYSGSKAVELGLVDKIGTLEAAIEAAAALAGTSDYITEYIQPTASFKERLLYMLSSAIPAMGSASSRDRWLLLAEAADYLNARLNELNFLVDPRGVYAHCLVRPVL